MKALAFLLLFCGAAYGAEITSTNVVGDITTITRDRTSTPASYTEISYRGKKRVMMLMKLPIGGGLTDLRRSYFVDGELLLTEGDGDGDGFLETVSVSTPESDDLEIFLRAPDGTVKPASTEEIRLVKEQIAITSRTNDKLLSGKELSLEQMDKLLKENRKKLEKLQEKEIAATNASRDVTNKVEEHKDKDGNPDLRVETTFRAKSKILEVTSRRNAFGRMVVSSRNYILNGNSIATEIVSPADGKFLSLIVRSPDNHATEFFKRNGDGSVVPASAANIDSVKGIN